MSKKQPRAEKGLYWGYEVSIAKNLKSIAESKQYDVKVLCDHSEQQSPSIARLHSFEGVDLAGKSMLIFFTGPDNIYKFIEKDQLSKISKEHLNSHLDYSFRLANLGVKQLRLEEELICTLSRLSDYVC